MIPFCKTSLGEEEKKAICDVIDSGWVVMGKKTQEFEEAFADYVGAKYAVFVDSGTSALDLTIKYLNRHGFLNAMYVPSLTFTATAEVLVHNRITPVFADVDKETMCLDTNKHPAIPVNLTGNKAKCESFIYDSAHRIERGDVKGSKSLWCYSFYATKNMSTIQGGMIAVNDGVSLDWLRKARDHGVTKGTTERYKEGSWAYDIDFIGWREKSDDVHAAIGLEQLKKLPEMNAKRNELVSFYNTWLGYNRKGNHLYPVLVSDRTQFINIMKEKGIQCSVHFLPLHKMTAYKKFAHGPDGKNISLPNTDYLGDRLVSLPLYPQLTLKEAEYIAQSALLTNLLLHE